MTCPSAQGPRLQAALSPGSASTTPKAWGGTAALGYRLPGCALVVGFFTGFMTGKFRQWFNVPSFITTLALFTALRGAANLITGGFPLSNLPSSFGFFGGGYLFGIPFPVYLFALTFVAMHFLMNHTSFGRAVYAVGGNMEAARLSGIDVWKVKSLTLALTGVLTAVSGNPHRLADRLGHWHHRHGDGA